MQIQGSRDLIPTRSRILVEIDHEIIPTIVHLPSADSFKKGQVWYLIVSIPDLCTITYFCCQLQAKVCTKYWLTTC